MKVLVTGGLGYIGSHTVVELQNSGFEVMIIDNLSNTSISVLDGIKEITGVLPEFFELDLRNASELKNFFENQKNIDGIIHFAASKAVGESVKKPLFYYQNNVSTLINLLSAVSDLEHQNLIFSSSCTVYGEAKEMPITEHTVQSKATSPYGSTKQIGEKIIKDNCSVNSNFHAIALRYFNPIGTHNSLHIGELPIGVPENLIPYITQTAIGIRKQLSIFGNDYSTKDGTCVRDYIHVVDVAKAHVMALQRIFKNKQQHNFEAFNIGTGKGNSVLEIVNTFERIANKKLNYKIVARRIGDVASAYADNTKANNELGWKSELSLEDAIRDAWQWEQKIRNK